MSEVLSGPYMFDPVRRLGWHACRKGAAAVLPVCDALHARVVAPLAR